jgi:signal peptidase I
MLQYVKFNETAANEKRFALPSGVQLFRFFAVKTAIILFMVYATLFLAVATPFLSPHSAVVYFVGGMICAVLFARLVNFAIKAVLYRGGALTVTKKGLIVERRGTASEVPGSSVTYGELNLLGDFVIRAADLAFYFPIGMLSSSERRECLSQFSDMAPSRTAVFRKIWEIGDAIVMAMILAVHIIQFVVQNFYIPTGSMENTLMVGDHLFAEKLTYGPRIPQMAGMKGEIVIHIPFITRDIHRGDVIIFHPPSPADEEKDYIKRCIAVGGDEFHIKDGTVWINGVKQTETYTKGVTSYRGFNEIKLEGVVPKGMVIAMGDNRENSLDSRFFGYVPVERIKAKALVMYYNGDQVFGGFDFSRFGLIR